MRYFPRGCLFGLGFAIVFSGCATAPRQRIEVVEVSPQETVEAQAAAVGEGGGFSVIGEGSSLTLPMAQDKAIRRARLALSESVVARVEKVRSDFVASAELTDSTAVDTWFEGVSAYLRELILGGARPAVEQSEQNDGLFTVWVMMMEDPATIVQAMEMRGVSDRQTYELIRASQAYRALLAEAERFAAFKNSQKTSLL